MPPDQPTPVHHSQHPQGRGAKSRSSQGGGEACRRRREAARAQPDHPRRERFDALNLCPGADGRQRDATDHPRGANRVSRCGPLQPQQGLFRGLRRSVCDTLPFMCDTEPVVCGFAHFFYPTSNIIVLVFRKI